MQLPVDKGQRVVAQVQHGDCCCDDGSYDDHCSNGPEQDAAAFLSTHTHTHTLIKAMAFGLMLVAFSIKSVDLLWSVTAAESGLILFVDPPVCS